jgi:hypothetical protein
METVFFERFQGKKIFCTFSEPKRAKKHLIIMAHGFRGTSIGPARAFVDFEQLLLQQGFSVLRYDHPSSGNSEGAHIDSSFNEWVDCIVFIAKRYLKQGYTLTILGQSMGATAAMIASTTTGLRGKLHSLLLWVPDPKSDFSGNPKTTYEENGQQYKGSFFQEAKNKNFFSSLAQYTGLLHVVYGEKDKYISKELRIRVIEHARRKGLVLILSKEDHSPWTSTSYQKVYAAELEILKKKEKIRNS